MSEQIVAVYGLAANPPHIGHHAIIQTLVSSGLADIVLVVPCGDRPDKNGLVEAEHRLAMTQRLCNEVDLHPSCNVIIDEADVFEARFTRTIDLLRRVENTFPLASIQPVIGMDLLQRQARFDGQCEIAATWTEGRTLLKTFSFLVFKRDGISGRFQHPTTYVLLDGHIPHVSSTELRQLIAAHQPIEHLVGPSVAAYIAEHGLYDDLLTP